MFDAMSISSRRMFLSGSVIGAGSLALAQMLAADDSLGTQSSQQTDRKRPLPSRAPRATNVICLFQHGGPSQVDLFDPKPELSRLNGKAFEGDLEIHFVNRNKKILLGSPFQFHQAGQSGMELSELLPHTASIADKITLIRSMKTESVDHEAALRVIHAGKIFPGRPSWASWVLYGLGTMNQELPGYIVLSDPKGVPVDGPHNWSSGFLPATYQGVRFRSEGSPVADLDMPADQSAQARLRQLECLKVLNEMHLRNHPGDEELAARITNFELAAKMQTSVPNALDLSEETQETHSLYGTDRQETADYAKRCLMARRLVERGVRFVQIFLSGQPWDTHNKNAENLRKLTARTDQPSAALVKDLERRGLLDSTIVIWAGEFGRLPISEGSDGRDHNRHAFSLWIAGGGFKQGYVHGQTDEIGYSAVEDIVPVGNLHATLLHALGLDHTRLSYPNDGREDSLTDHLVTGARVIPELLS